ncbi:hypothetical protein LIER_38575 [Lithospermum erythrorhizon]|uniref:Integrase catalytic domain-containing protein n=1 Tax=Lithospermum erythrorhizon TaxID=34254 RepID=A0AAV3Q1T3_LITER
MRWHSRLGLSPFRVISPIAGFTDNNVHSDPCFFCPMAKQQRDSFPISSTVTTDLFQLFHADLWGPYKVADRTGARYVLTLVEDYSRCTWTLLITSKSQTLHVFQMFLAMVQTQFNKTFKCLRTDNGTEFVNTQFSQLLNTNGIIHQRSCVHTPQQNDLPSIVHLRVFGCLCYAVDNTPHKDKFSPRSHPGVFVGYPPNQKAYKIFDLIDKKIIVSRDVMFYEDIFPYRASKSPLSQSTYCRPNVSIRYNPTYDPTPIPNSPIQQQSAPAPGSVSINQEVCDPIQQQYISISSDSTTPNVCSPNVVLPSLPNDEPLRRSTRPKVHSTWLHDYVRTSVSTSSSSLSCTAAHALFLVNLSKAQEPYSYKQARVHDEWVQAMQSEMSALEQNGTWHVVALPDGN